MLPSVAILVSTYNRKEELAKTLVSAQAQLHVCEIIVVDDASTDGTNEYVRMRFPGVRVLRNVANLGLIASRNRGVAESTSDIVIIIDDDATFTSSTIAQSVASVFAVADRVGAIAIPHFDAGKEHVIYNRPSRDEVHVVQAFVGTAQALRRDLFLRLGGFRGELIRQGEETDYCLRLLRAGYLICTAPMAPIRHDASPVRNHGLIAYYGARNSILLHAWHRPWMSAAAHATRSVLGHIAYGMRYGQLPARIRGLYAGVKSWRLAKRYHQPIPHSVWVTWSRLKRPLPLRALVR